MSREWENCPFHPSILLRPNQVKSLLDNLMEEVPLLFVWMHRATVCLFRMHRATECFWPLLPNQQGFPPPWSPFCDFPQYIFPFFFHFLLLSSNLFLCMSRQTVYLCNAWERWVKEGVTRPAKKCLRQKKCTKSWGNSCERQLASSKALSVTDKLS